MTPFEYKVFEPRPQTKQDSELPLFVQRGLTDEECEDRLREIVGASVSIPKRCPKCKGEIQVSLFPADHPDGGGSCLLCGWVTGWMI